MSKFRPMRRIKQQTSKEECEYILQIAKRGVLAVVGDGGYPYAVPMDYVYEDGNIYFHCAKEGHKLDAISYCDKASFCVLNDGEQESGEWWYHFTSVICFGRVRVVKTQDDAMEKLRMLGSKYFPNRDYLEEEMEKDAQRAVVLVFTVENMTGKQIQEK